MHERVYFTSVTTLGYVPRLFVPVHGAEDVKRLRAPVTECQSGSYPVLSCQHMGCVGLLVVRTCMLDGSGVIQHADSV